MRMAGALAAILLAAPPALAQESPSRHALSAENNWHIDDETCAIDAGWDDVTGVLVTLHDDHHDFGMYSDAKNFPALKPEKVIDITFAAENVPIDGRPYQVIGHKDGKVLSYVSDVDDAMLDAVAKAGSLQLIRGNKLLLDLNMLGFAEAVAAMRQCEAALPPPPELVEDAADAAEHAADAAMDATPE
jgi:hypothetical protein